MQKTISSIRGLIFSALVMLPLSSFSDTSNDLATNEEDVFSSNIPIVYITTSSTISKEEKVMGRMKIIDNGEGKRNHATDSVFDYNGYIGIKLRGNSSLSFDQKKYTVETWDSLGNDIKASLLGMPAESDWVLIAPYNDISLVRDAFAFNMWNEMGHWAPRCRMCEVFVNDEYVGVYNLCEKIKRDANRVDIAKLKTEDIADRELTGGYIVRVDAYDDEDATFESKVPGIQTSFWGGGNTGTVVWTIYYPKKKNLQPEQKKYIQAFVDSMEVALQSAGKENAAEEYSRWVDIPSFVDYFIHTELSLNADGFKRSAYFFKGKDKKSGEKAKMFAGPVWDYNLAYGNCNFCNASDVEAWVYEGCSTNPTPAFWKQLTNDESFMQQVRERYAQLRSTIISQKSIDDFFDTKAALLDEAKDRHYAKYSNLLGKDSGGGWGWWGGGNTNPVAYFAAYLVDSYEEEISTVKEWFGKRLSFLDKNWGYKESSVKTLSGYFDIEIRNAGEGKIVVCSDRDIYKITVYSLGGNKLVSQFSKSGNNCYQIQISDNYKKPVIVVCDAMDGNSISRKIKL